ncbi:PREDICTED: uncharacterized protein LOC108366303 [Rhagoletis zephyria]|uniref:uncharacterized protein LOC108366303 n=1 Tax=Rhagoletis zephyria TaxID=28612 RepID=UPI00081199C1|nr:PREDICTED: uncharacterized protein LOC108366303 [Rhagoletis zephyria]XP_036326125.1 uncharacterized protein LOC118739097 [Rhagoletis pomonella]
MSSFSKLNPTQKDVMAEFMTEHPNLAQNNFSNSVQGRATSARLWEELSRRLNDVGPPIKDSRTWRKVFADQKYHAKKKLFLNKASKHRGSYGEKVITASEEMIIEAAGLKACVEDDQCLEELGNSPAAASEHSSGNSDSCPSDGEASSSHSVLSDPLKSEFPPLRVKAPRRNTQRQKSGSDEKLALLQQNLKSVADFQTNLVAKIDRLVETQEKMLSVQERLLAIKEEKHRIQQTSRETDVEIKRLELETLAMVINNLKL